MSDWRPFSYLTLHYDIGEVKDWAWMYELDQLDSGTRLTTRLSDPGDEVWAQIGEGMREDVADQANQLEKVLDSG